MHMSRSLVAMLVGILVLGGIGYLILSDRFPQAAAESSDLGAEATVTYSDSLTADEVATLSSVERIDDHPFYTMHFAGSYRADLADGSDLDPSEQTEVSTEQVTEPAFACSLFVTFAEEAAPIFGRNFDWSYHPILLLFTDPPDGYASASFVDLSYFVSEDLVDALVETPIEARRGLLETPFAPFDGMNECGLAIGMAAVPSAEMPSDPEKETRGSIEVMRDILDYAATVDEAVDILTSVNVDMTGGPDIHYLIADSEGHSAIVEFADGSAYVFRSEMPWQHMTNFRLGDVPDADRPDTCGRYAMISEELEAVDGRLTIDDAMALLESVHQASETKPVGTLWSAVYEMQASTVHVAIQQRFDQVYTLTFP
jgi:hypothetical protein